ncbi:MAG: ATP:cob(I)alamin adenosyltransferase, partial [Bacteroidota bacterium]
MTQKIYTKLGDTGKTSLAGGQKVAKNHEQLNACGTVDELNAWIGLIRSYDLSKQEKDTLISIQKHLFLLCSDLGYDKENAKTKRNNTPLLGNDKVDFLENKIDKMNETLPVLTNFIIPGGYIPAA